MAFTRLGLVVHPRRDIGAALETLEAWASAHDVAVGQIPIAGQSRQVAAEVDAAACDFVIALGGDGTTLAGLHAAAPASRPVLGVACGSIGALTSISADRLDWALEQMARGSWTTHALPGLEIDTDGARRVALNDFTAIRNGTGQVITGVTVDGELYARMAGDGIVVATPLGSSAYTMAAGGPILACGAEGIVLTPLASHGGVAPPLVVGPESTLELTVEHGYGGSRFELDGQVLTDECPQVTIGMRLDYATMVRLEGEESTLAGLRRRKLVIDGPRILARDARRGSVSP
jgi:NAD+ kinase